MQQQSVQNGTDMRVSAIPLMPVRTRDRVHGNVHSDSSRSAGQQGFPGKPGTSAPKFEDIMSERPDVSVMYHSSLPEDHLEDILTLPIAAELKSRRSKTSLASDRTTSATAFPSSSTSNTRRTGDTVPNNVSQDGLVPRDKSELRDERHDSLRKRSKSSPMRSESPPQQAYNDASASSGSTVQQDTMPADAAIRPSDNKKAKLASSPTAGKGRYIPQTPPAASASKSRNRAVTNNVGSSTARKPSYLTSPSEGPRRPLQAGPSISNRQVSSPLKKSTSSTPPARARSSSTSLLSNSIQHDWDETSKPPWLEETPSYLYKSDIENIQPGSLADIARHAQGRSQTSQGADGDTSLLGDTSIRSWDDVILPAVAKQIRAQQILEMQKNAERGECDDHNDLLVTDWNADGTPRKWQRLQSRSTGPAEKSGPFTAAQSPREYVDKSCNGGIGGLTTQTFGMDSQRDQESRQASSQQFLQTDQVFFAKSANSQADTEARRTSDHGGRRPEAWETSEVDTADAPFRNERSLLQMQHINSTVNPQMPHPYYRDHEHLANPDSLQDGRQQSVQQLKQERVKYEDSHSRGCCRCTIM